MTSPDLQRRLAAAGITPEQLAAARARADLTEGVARPPAAPVVAPPVALGPNSPLRGTPADPASTPERRARKAAAGRKRADGGRNFEDELNDTHASYSQRSMGCVWPHFVATRLVRRPGGLLRVTLPGTNPVDYTGHLRLLRHAGAWVAHPLGARVPVVFDAKTLGDDARSYRHDPDELQQVKDLLLAHQNGAAAFLLVRVAALGRVFAIGPEHLPQLLLGRGVKLYETRGGGAPRVLAPSCAYVPGFGWPYAPLVPAVCPAIAQALAGGS